MKKFYLLILLPALMFALSSCKSDITESIPDTDMQGIEEWYDNNSCRVIGNGSPEHRVQSVILKRVAALDNAVINARELMLEFLVKTYIEHQNSDIEYETVKNAFSRAYSDLINNGVVTHEKYSVDDNCTIVFIVSRKNLKKDILSGAALK